MAEWGRKEYAKAWPSRTHVWTLGAILLTVAFFVFAVWWDGYENLDGGATVVSLGLSEERGAGAGAGGSEDAVAVHAAGFQQKGPDVAGRKETQTDSLGHITTYTYDAELTALSGVRGSFQYGYDNARNRISVTDGNNNTTQYQYDARKRLTVTTYSDGKTTANTYTRRSILRPSSRAPGAYERCTK